MLVCPLCRLVVSDLDPACPRDGHEAVPGREVTIPPAVLERFAIVEPYAQGESGDLFLADDTKTGRRGVLKLLRLGAEASSTERSRLKRELLKQATLEHGVLSVPLATGEVDDHLWLFREWHEGVSLRVKLARSGALSATEAYLLVSDVASALDALHRVGLLHRDLSPEHVILMPQPSGVPRVAVIDAGIAAPLPAETAFEVRGKAPYVSPEEANGKLVSFRSDLYALGCLFYEMLTGQPPFTGTVKEVIDAHAHEPAPTPQLALPGGVSSLLLKLLSKEPRERPFSAQQVRRALAPFLPQDPSTGRESTQTFEKLNQQRRANAPRASGTLPPRAKRSAKTAVGMPAAAPASRAPGSIPPPPSRASKPPPSPNQTEPLSALDLSAAEEILATPTTQPRKKRVARTIVGMPTSAAAPPADPTQELSPLDLEHAEEILSGGASAPTPSEPPGAWNDLGGGDAHRWEQPAAAPRAARSKTATVMGMPAQARASSIPPPPRPSQPTTGSLENAFGDLEAKTEKQPMTVPAPVPPRAEAPVTAVLGRLDDMSSSPAIPVSARPSERPDADASYAGPPASAEAVPPWSASTLDPSLDDGDELDYEDLAETRAFDKSAPAYDPSLRPSQRPGVEPAPTPAAEQAPPVANPTRAVDEDTAPVRAVRTQRRMAPWMVVAAIVSVCSFSALFGGAAVLVLAPQPAEVVVATSPPATPEAVSPSTDTPSDLATNTAVDTPEPVAVITDDEEATEEDRTLGGAGADDFAADSNDGTEDEGAEVDSAEDDDTEGDSTEDDAEEASAQARRPGRRRARRRARAARRARQAPAPRSRMAQFQATREEALTHFRARRFAQAASAYERATSLNPRHAGSFAGLGAARLAQGQPAQAVRAYRRATELQPRHAGFHAALGQAYRAAGNESQARQSFQRALALDPSNRAARAGLRR